jgi:hypothetical protein
VWNLSSTTFSTLIVFFKSPRKACHKAWFWARGAWNNEPSKSGPNATETRWHQGIPNPYPRWDEPLHQLEENDLNLWLQGKETERGAGRISEAAVVPCICFWAPVTWHCPSTQHWLVSPWDSAGRPCYPEPWRSIPGLPRRAARKSRVTWHFGRRRHLWTGG